MSGTKDGRTARCPACRSANVCKLCEQRLRYGDPKPTETWAMRLSLTDQQIGYLLQGAGEFMQLHEEYVRRSREYGLTVPEHPSAVQFMDWVAASLGPVQNYEWDGSSGGTAQLNTHSSRPFELPQASTGTRTTRGRAA